ncbi:hypothetical protein V5O48_014993 [Marasmius crinis-equi]|uniref:Uncharacterized protein n=1 Tax=Marasmius crinis-equi TaxID=585013 RepID=A0ABR3EW28_9AGAR
MPEVAVGILRSLICLLLGLSACGINTTHLYAVAPPGTAFLAYPEAKKWVVVDVVTTVLTNTYSTTLIAWRIWVTHRANKEYGGVVSARPGSTTLMAALAMFVESALLFSIWVLFFASLYGAKSNLEALAADNIAVMAGIAFSLINVRIALERAKSLSAHNTATTSVSRVQFNALNGTVGTDIEDLAYPMRPRIDVHQIKTSTTDYGSESKAMLGTNLQDDNASD